MDKLPLRNYMEIEGKRFYKIMLQMESFATGRMTSAFLKRDFQVWGSYELFYKRTKL